MTLVKLNNRFDSQVNRYNSFDSLFDSFSNSQPSVNIIETDEAFVIELAVPGYAKKDISIGLENNVLTVSHEHLEDQKQDLYRFSKREFSRGSFTRSFRLSRWVDNEKIEASFKNGILKIEIQKKAEAIAKPARDIKIS